MHRRRFLTVLPLVTTLTGCTSDSDQADVTSPSATDPTPPSTSSTPTVRLRSSYRHGINDDGIGVLPPDNDQFAFIQRPTSDGSPPLDAFTLKLGDRRIDPVSSTPGFSSWTPGVESVYTDENRTGVLMFDVPAVETDDAVLSHDGTRYPLADDAHERLATAPAFTLESVTVPESVPPDDRIELRVTVTNEGDRSGAYLAGFRIGGYPKTLDVPVAPGETESGSVRYDAYADSETMYFHFNYPGGDRDYEVTVESETESTTPTR